jgi:hypothetical protein
MGQLRTANKRHKRVVAKLVAKKTEAAAPVAPAKAAS